MVLSILSGTIYDGDTIYFNFYYFQLFGNIFLTTCGALDDLVPFIQFKRREKHPWRSVTFSEFAG